MVVGYEVFEDGTLQEIELTKDGLDSTKVLCVVDDSTKSIYLWKGSQAGIRSKFIGARVATNLRTEYGFHFKVRPIDEGSEPPTFFSAVEGTTTATPVIKPGASAPPPKPPVPTSSPPPTPSPVRARMEEPEPTRIAARTPPPTPAATPSPAPRARVEEPQAEPVRPTVRAPPPTPVATRTSAPVTTSPSPVSAGAISPEISSMIHELEVTEPPEGYHRELLIVFNQLFTVAEHKVKVFGQEKVERRFEMVRDPPEGTFMAEGFIPRVIVKDGKVLGIELLKGTPDAILSPIKTEMRERLTDLISFFKSELEEPPTGDASKKTTKRKLVAK